VVGIAVGAPGRQRMSSAAGRQRFWWRRRRRNEAGGRKSAVKDPDRRRRRRRSADVGALPAAVRRHRRAIGVDELSRFAGWSEQCELLAHLAESAPLTVQRRQHGRVDNQQSAPDTHRHGQRHYPNTRPSTATAAHRSRRHGHRRPGRGRRR